MTHVKLRASECVLILFFAYVAAIAPWFRDRMNLRAQPVLVLAAVTATLLLLAVAEGGKLSNIVGVVRDWLPLALVLIAFREMELFLPRHFNHYYESIWIRWDHVVLQGWHVQALIESLGKVIPFYLEFCYLLVYGIGAYCLAVLYVQTRRKTADAFLTVYLVGTLVAYALFPYFPSEPPRYVFPGVDAPHVSTWVRRLNLFILSKATIHSGVFPSAHVSSAFSAAWAMLWLLPRKKLIRYGLLCYAVSVSLATIYGRYHYCADVIAGFGVSLTAAFLCLWHVLRDRNKNADWDDSDGRKGKL